MSALILTFQIVSASFSESLLIAYGPKTPERLKDYFANETLIDLSTQINLASLSSIDWPGVILDISLDSSNFLALDLFSDYFQVPYFTLTKTEPLHSSNFRFFTLPSIDLESKFLTIMIKFLKWETFSIFASNTPENIQILTSIKSSFSKFQLKTYIYEPTITEELMDILIKRFIKTTAERHLLVLDQGKSLEICVNLLKTRKINEYGNYFLFKSSSIYEIDLEGSLIIANDEAEKFNTIEQFYYELLLKSLSQFYNLDIESIKKFCPNNSCFNTFTIVNQRNGKKVKIGTIQDEVILDQEILFPGNNVLINANVLKAKLQIMIANGTTEANSLVPNYVFPTYYYGAQYALDQVNWDERFGNFEYELIPTDCGNINFDITWSINCLSKHVQTHGLAYVSSFLVGAALGNLFSFRAFNIFLPQVSPFGISDVVNDESTYPEFIKLSGKFNEYVQNSIFMFNFFKWHEFIIISGDDLGNQFLMQEISSTMIKMGFKFINPKKFQMIPSNYTREDFESYKDLFEFIRDSKCRLLLTIYTNPGMILEGLYDVGLRKGEIIMLGNFNLYDSLLDDIDEKFMIKRKEIFNGALLTTQIEYEGEYGRKVETVLKEKYGNVINMCLTHDALLTVTHSIRYIIAKGENYEDPKMLIRTMRTQKFVGCSGDVYFIPKENSRNRAWLGVSQCVVNSTVGNSELLRVASFNKFAVIASRSINQPIWPTGEDTVPSNYRTKGVCVYDKNKQRSKLGVIQIHSVSGLFLAVVLITAIFSKRKFESPVEKMVSQVYPTYYDHLFMMFFFSQCLQIMALQPSSSIYLKITGKVTYTLGLDLISAFDLKFEDYWRFLNIFLIISAGFGLLTVIVVAFKNVLKKKFYFLAIFEYIAESILPVLGHIGFLPIFKMSFSIYQCEEGTSDDLFESFFFRDCTEYCYKGKHKFYVIVSSLALLAYTVTSIYYRPYWETTQTDLRIKTKAFYLSVLSVFQVILVLIKINVEIYSEIISGFASCGVLFCMIVLTLVAKPYSYERAIFLHALLLFLNFWSYLIGSLCLLLGFEYWFRLVLYCGLFLWIMVGLGIASRLPTRFVADHTNAISVLIRFQFSKKLNEIITKSKYFGKFDGMNLNSSTVHHYFS